MSLFTSDSRRRRVGTLAIAVMALSAVAGLELFTRTALIPASKDLSRLAQYPARARALCATTGRRVAFVGNSLTDAGVDPTLFGRLMGDDVTADKFVVDGSSINTWIWVIERQFWKQAITPDLIIVNFNRNNLEDGRGLELGRLALFFTDHRDWLDLFRYDITSLEERTDFLIANVWATYAVRDRIKERTLQLIPGYRRYRQAQNRANFRAEQLQRRSDPDPRALETLKRLLAKAQTQRTRLLFTPFPSARGPGPPLPYEVAAQTRRVITDAGMLYVDARRLVELERRHYQEDGIHLASEGQALYTRHLAEAVRATWRP